MKRVTRRQFVAAAAAGPLIAGLSGHISVTGPQGNPGIGGVQTSADGEVPGGSGPTYREVDNRIYGARADERGEIGGVKYKQIFSTGDQVVDSVDGLIEALAKAKSGEVVFIPSGTIIDLTTLIYIEELVLEIPAGVTLAGDRGHDGSEGALICSDAFKTPVMIRAAGPDVRITGLRIQGPNSKRHMEHHRRSFGPGGPGSSYYYKFPVSSGISTLYDGFQVDNCELSAFAHSAVRLTKGTDHRIHHNFIHHCQYNGLGYGVSLAEASALIECNLFDSNRHSIAGTGAPGCSYTARNNVECGISLSHCFDMHGGRDRKDGTNIAGTYIEIVNNTFRAPQYAVGIRGEPEEACVVSRNWFPGHTEAAKVVRGYERTQVTDNLYGTGNATVK